MKRNIKLATKIAYLPGPFYKGYMLATLTDHEKETGYKPCISRHCVVKHEHGPDDARGWPIGKWPESYRWWKS